MAFFVKLERSVRILLVLGILVFINIIASLFNASVDLSEDRRFSLTPASIHTIQNINDNIYIRVLLDGEFPAGFKRLRQGVNDLLFQYKKRNGFISFEFENPN